MYELDNVKVNTKLIPSWASIDEGAMILIENSERDYNRMMQRIGLTELAHTMRNGGRNMMYMNEVESDSAMPQEDPEWDSPMYSDAAADQDTDPDVDYAAAAEVEKRKGLKGLIDTIINWIKARWADLLGLFNKALQAIKKKLDEFHKKVATKRLKKFPDKIKKLKDKKYGTTYEYPEWSEFERGNAFDLMRPLRTLDEKMNKASYVYLNKNKTTRSDSRESLEVMKQNCETAKEGFFKDFGLTKDNKESDLREKIIANIRGKEIDLDKKYIVAHWEEIVNRFGDNAYSKLSSSIKTQIKNFKKNFDASIDDIKKSKKAKTITGEYYKTYLPYLKFSKNMCTLVSGASLSAVREKMMKEMGIILRISLAFGKDVEDSKDDKKDTKATAGDVAATSAVDAAKAAAAGKDESETVTGEMASLFHFDF